MKNIDILDKKEIKQKITSDNQYKSWMNFILMVKI